MFSPTQADFGDAGVMAIRAMRKSAIADREFFTGIRNQCGRDNPDAARYAAVEIKTRLRLEKACTIVLKWIDGDTGYTVPRQWPSEMSGELRLALSAAYLADADTTTMGRA